MMIIKSSAYNDANIYCNDWSNILFTFGEWFMQIFGVDGRVTHSCRQREGHFGTCPLTRYDQVFK
jgi:hypothetical protein